MGPVERSLMQVEVWVSLAPREVKGLTLALPVGSTVAQAIEATGWVGCLPGLDATTLYDGLQNGAWSVAVWGRKTTLGHVLREDDRVELLRALTVDPKEARRLRYRAQGEKLPKGHQRPKAGDTPKPDGSS